MMRVLVTGGSGFLGKALTKKLLEKSQFEVHSFSRNGSGGEKGIIFHSGSILDEVRLREVFTRVKPEWVFHLASDTRHDKDLQVEKEVFATNVEGTKFVLKVARETGVKAFAYSGSFEEYGPVTTPFIEDMEPRPVSIYGRSKLEATQSVVEASSKNFKTIVLRFPVLYGENQSRKTFIGGLIRAINEGKNLKMTKGEQTRDFLHIDDAADALIASLENIGNCAGEIINISVGKEIPLIEVVRFFEKETGRSIADIGAIPYREGEQMHYFGDATKALKLLKFKPKITLESGLKKLLEVS